MNSVLLTVRKLQRGLPDLLRYLKHLSFEDLIRKLSHLGVGEEKGRLFSSSKGSLTLIDRDPPAGDGLRSFLKEEGVSFLFDKGMLFLSFQNPQELDRLILKAPLPSLIRYLGEAREVLENVQGKPESFAARGKKIHLGTGPPLVMGVLNVTSDSFYDGGKYLETGKAVERALQMVREGADIIDVGGESTRPGSFPVSEKEEIKRVTPVISALSKVSECIISVDTYKSSVASEALSEGAHMVNDISGLRFSPDMATTVAEYGAALVLMHIKGTPRDMQDSPWYGSISDEILEEMGKSVRKAVESGVPRENIILDPGFGFGKRWEDNFFLLNNLEEFKSPGYPLLVGTSRKSFIGIATGKDAEGRSYGTAATVSLAVYNGADIIRVHDVKEMMDVIKVSWDTKKARAC